ncbi:MAG: ABC transporter ATP-binding protein [archaeon]
MKSKTVIELRNVWKVYRMGDTEVGALQGINLNIKQGEFIAIQGPSGSGKSTMMNMVGCLDVPTKGEIFLDGQNIARLDESALAQVRGKKIGFIFQKFNLITSMTAKENIMLPMVFQGFSRDERTARAEELLALVGLEDRMDFTPNQLSGGQQQRVAIARSLAINPEVILADEPTGNLDSKTGMQIMDFLQDLHEKHGKTIIMVTHDDHLATFADRIELLKDGQIVTTKHNHRARMKT